MYPASSLSRRVLSGFATALILVPMGFGAASPDTNTPATPVVAPALPPATTEQELDQRLEGKFFFLRGFYIDDKIEYDVNGKIKGTPQQGSFTLSGIEVKKVRSTKHSVIIEADRVGLHFFGGLPYEDDTKPFERIKVSKKPVEITIDRLVIEPEKKKKKKDQQNAKNQPATAAKPGTPGQTTTPATAQSPTATQTASTDNATSGVANPPDVTFEEPATPAAAKPNLTANAAPSTTPQLPAEPAHPDPKESWMQLSKAVQVVFAPGLDESVISTLPDYWQTYFATKQGKSQAERVDNSVLHPGNGVVSPKLLSSLDPASNDYAQKANIAGMTLLSTVVGASGLPTHVTIIRPIGFGLDERAVEAVSKAHFRPGLKDGQPVPVVVNLQVTFRIYNDLTRPQPGAAQPAPPPAATPASNPQPSHSNGKEVAAVAQQ